MLINSSILKKLPIIKVKYMKKLILFIIFFIATDVYSFPIPKDKKVSFDIIRKNKTIGNVTTDFKLEDERNMQNCKNSRTVKLASTFQFVYTQILGKVVNFPLFVENGWEGRIVMFPSKLLHIVYPFQTSDDYRISIAGNLH